MQLQAGAKISESEGADKLEHYRKYVDVASALVQILIPVKATGPVYGIVFPYNILDRAERRYFQFISRS